jgi:indolepyruvate decarboxylase
MDDNTPTSISRRVLIQASATSLVAAQAASVAAGALVSEAAAQPAMIKTEQYILQRLSQANVKKLFGVPGATCSPMFESAKAPIDIVPIVTSSDLAAGHAADGYARIRGLGAVAVTYGVGTMSLLPAIAGAYVERSPVVVINGGPSALDLQVQRDLGSLFSHSIGHTQSDMVMFREVTEYAVRVERKEDVPGAVDRAITIAKTKQRPVYIEIAKHVWGQPCRAPTAPLDFTVAPTGNETAIARDIIAKLGAATKPALLLGIEVQRYGLSNEVAALVNRLQIPWSSTLLGKSVIPEQTPGFVGVYSGENALPSVTRIVESADALFMVGCVMGRQYRRLAQNSKARIALAFNGEVRVGLGGAHARTASLRALLSALQAQPWTPKPALIAGTRLPGLSFDQRRGSITLRTAGAEAGLTYDEVIRDVSNGLDETFVAVTDTSLSMYPAADMDVTGANGFICNSVWQSIGYSVGAAVGVGAAQGRRPIAICGDGGFQMTAQSLTTMVKERMNAIVIVLDNGLHSIEQWILDKSYYASPRPEPEPYLALGHWNYADVAKAMGFVFSRAVVTPGEFRQALNDAKANTTGPSFIVVKIKPHDLPSGLGS